MNKVGAGSHSDVAVTLRHAIGLIRTTCLIGGSRLFLEDIRERFERRGLLRAVQSRDTGALFGWMLEMFSFQGVSDRVAESYIAANGSISWSDVATGLNAKPTCPRLMNYWTFDRCGFDKGSGCCSEAEHVQACPLPHHRLRNGRLNQTAYSLYFFLRDVAGDDLVGWIDRQLAASKQLGPAGQAEALIEPLRNVFGVSDKILTMSLSTLLLGAGSAKPAWPAIGAQMIAVDTLVHAYLHRTGILRRLGADHAYGGRCYADGGCADIVRNASASIDAREFNRSFPQDFPRFVQNAIWRFCAADGLGVCNGNMINDRRPCQNVACRLYAMCDHVTLKAEI